MALISLAGIAEAIDNLNLKETTLKGKLLDSIRARFPDEESLDTITAIDPLELIDELWAPTAPAEIKAKRKNLSSLKSSINKSLKDGIKSGANPEGLIIGRDNVFIISDEKKNLLLDKLALDGDGSHSLLDTLAAINDLLAGIVTPTNKSEALKILDQLDSTRETLTKLAGLSEAVISDKETAPSTEFDDQAPVEEFEIDDDTVIEFVEEEISPEAADEDDSSDQAGPEADNDGLADQATGDLGETGGSDDDMAAMNPEDDWDSFEVVDDDIDIVDEEQLSSLAEESDTEDLADGDEVEIIEEEALVTEEIEEVDEEELDELDLDEEAIAEAAEQEDEELADDWDSFEVTDDDFDIVDDEQLSSLTEESDTEDLVEADEVEIIEEEALVTEEIEEVDEEELDELDLDEEAIAEAAEQEDEELADDWDSFEVTDDDFDIVDDEQLSNLTEESNTEDLAETDEIDIVDARDELAPTGSAMATEAEPAGPSGDSYGGGRLADRAEVGGGDSAIGPGPGMMDKAPASTAQGAQESDDWHSFEVSDDDLDFKQPAAAQADQEPGPQTTGQIRSMDLSQYIEPEEASLTIPNVLQENNDEYVRQILERFMPKFIKIPAGRYPVGGPQRRKTDRTPAQISLPEFYLGQLPITNDLFDFFVRETGYQTEAEQQGYGVVTSGRLRSGLQQETGRHTLAISKGVISRQIKGANWRHPEGPGSSLDNRGQHPVVQVSRLDAQAFAAWAGKRLPSEDEWEAAARGQAGLVFPWGDERLPLANLEGQQAGGTIAVTFFGRESMSPFGLLDMLGNVFEWTASTYANKRGNELAILKGGSWATAQFTCADRLLEPANTWSNTIGFRCAVDAI